jgi:hypothetical protein
VVNTEDTEDTPPTQKRINQFLNLWNKAKEKPSMHTKFEELWIRPYVIENILGFNAYMLQYMKGKRLMLPVNGKHLKGLKGWTLIREMLEETSY